MHREVTLDCWPLPMHLSLHQALPSDRKLGGWPLPLAARALAPAPRILGILPWALPLEGVQPRGRSQFLASVGMVRQRMDRGQDNSHREWPDHTNPTSPPRSSTSKTSVDKDLLDQWKNTQSSGFLQFRCELGRGQSSSTPAAQDRAHRVIARLSYGAQV